MQTIIMIAKDIAEAGGAAYIAGGFVRDMMLKRPSKDIDVEVYNLSMENLAKILSKYGNVKECGKSYGVLKVGNYDFSVPRTDRKTGTGYKGFEVKIDPKLSFHEACKRRDITINAMLYDPLSGKVIDPFNGMKDLKNGILRHVNNKTFGEDPLRAIRVAQFKARFDFLVDEETKNICMELIDEMHTLSKERFFVEFEKILMKSEKPSIAFNFMLETGILNAVFPELAKLEKIRQGTLHHPEGNAFIHTMFSLDSVPIAQRRFVLMVAILCHDFGKGVCKEEYESDEIIHHKGHADEGLDATEQFLRRFTDETELINNVKILCKYHMRPFDIINTGFDRHSIRRLAMTIEKESNSTLNFEDLLVIHEADLKGTTKVKDLSHVDVMRGIYFEIKNEIKPLVRGKHLIGLGLKPSPVFNKILGPIFEAQIDGKFNTLEEGIEYTKEFLKSFNTETENAGTKKSVKTIHRKN